PCLRALDEEVPSRSGQGPDILSSGSEVMKQEIVAQRRPIGGATNCWEMLHGETSQVLFLAVVIAVASCRIEIAGSVRSPPSRERMSRQLRILGMGRNGLFVGHEATIGDDVPYHRSPGRGSWRTTGTAVRE